ncbi:hypothetical protein BO71DRAFT_421253 [Aspergillus ellipticus CBS 707.79]|uniref:Uncharacterized protein n=1 Tax=Aspergillus ellipticus CBS 707.79 TaxID=1448320 RepID=A0A319D3M5_9EURO|nr:hypothetical protein BO71DRAFT_421253 [Aspergillus ellipticus CBS 707.79]
MPGLPPTGSLALSGQEVVLEPLPDLDIGPETTTSSARHNLHFAGKLRLWSNFVIDALNHHAIYQWSSGPVITKDPAPLVPHSLSHEQVTVGDENGAQGRFNQLFGDYKSCVIQKSTRKTPDTMIRTTGGHPLAVGEIKTPWVDEHSFSLAMRNGQIAMYMEILELKYAYMTTYNETMFFCQEDIVGQTILLYSDVIRHDSAYVPGLSATVRQCFFYLAALGAETSSHTTSPSRTTGWVTSIAD